MCKSRCVWQTQSADGLAVLTQDVGTAWRSDEDTEAVGSELAVRAVLSGAHRAVLTEEWTVPSVCSLPSHHYHGH